MLQVQKFYTAPTLIRSLMREGDDHVKGSDTSSLQVLGTVGEPINPEAWKWYHSVSVPLACVSASPDFEACISTDTFCIYSSCLPVFGAKIASYCAHFCTYFCTCFCTFFCT